MTPLPQVFPKQPSFNPSACVIIMPRDSQLSALLTALRLSHNQSGSPTNLLLDLFLTYQSQAPKYYHAPSPPLGDFVPSNPHKCHLVSFFHALAFFINICRMCLSQKVLLDTFQVVESTVKQNGTCILLIIVARAPLVSFHQSSSSDLREEGRPVQ